MAANLQNWNLGTKKTNCKWVTRAAKSAYLEKTIFLPKLRGRNIASYSIPNKPLW